jgi:hypothetical protein
MQNTSKKIFLIVTLLLTVQYTTGCNQSQNPAETATDSNSPAATADPVDEISPPAHQPEALSSKDAVPLWEEKIAKGKEWTTHVNNELDRLGKNLLDVVPADKDLFCPRYDKLSYSQRKQYWTFMLSAMTRFESNFKTSTTYTEAFNDSNGKRVISRGLLQLSIESGNAYGCGFKTAADLHDPLQNLSCGIRILDRWLDRDERIGGKVNGQWRGGARYWAVLRAGDKTSYKSILSWSQSLPFCK